MNVFNVSKFKCILLDFDGVVADSMNDNFKAWNYAFGKKNLHITKNEYFLLEGRTTKEVVESVFYSNKLALDVGMQTNIIKDKEEYYMKNNAFHIYDGVEEHLNSIRAKGYLLGLVSGAGLNRIKQTCGGWVFHLFDTVITGDDVNEGKPSSEPYLRAAENLDMPSSKCIVIENAPLGIDSAVNAGMYCIAVTTTLTKNYLHSADIVMGSTVEVLSLFNKG